MLKKLLNWANVLVPLALWLFAFTQFTGAQAEKVALHEKQIEAVDTTLSGHIAENYKADAEIVQRLARMEAKLDMILQRESKHSIP